MRLIEDDKTTNVNAKAVSLIDDPSREFRNETFVNSFIFVGKYNTSDCLPTSSSYLVF